LLLLATLEGPLQVCAGAGPDAWAGSSCNVTFVTIPEPRTRDALLQTQCFERSRIFLVSQRATPASE
jgi:hypothetical protein